MATNFKLQVSSSQNGTYTDLTNYIAYGGMKITRNDIDAANSGRDTQDGLMHRHRVAIKTRIDVTCRPLTTAEAKIVLTAINPEWVWVKYYDIISATTVTKKMYSNNVPVVTLIAKSATDYWKGLTFPLIEE